MSNHPCCPPNAEKYLAPDYNTIGDIQSTKEGIDFYSVGKENIENNKKAIYLCPDIFGWNSGRTRNIADYFSTHGYYVVVPKLLTPPINGGTDGDGIKDRNDLNLDVIRERWSWDQIQPSADSITKYLKSLGLEKLYLVGFCW
jgi:dienelactone hydrolase